jgi:hypothetical protein
MAYVCIYCVCTANLWRYCVFTALVWRMAYVCIYCVCTANLWRMAYVSLCPFFLYVCPLFFAARFRLLPLYIAKRSTTLPSCLSPRLRLWHATPEQNENGSGLQKKGVRTKTILTFPCPSPNGEHRQRIPLCSHSPWHGTDPETGFACSP